MNYAELNDWLDRHHVHVIRTEGSLADGIQYGRFIHRDKFVETLPLGMTISGHVLGLDLGGMPHGERPHAGVTEGGSDIFQKPDLATLISDGTDADLGHCIVDLVDVEGNEINICPRTRLRGAVSKLAELGYSCRISVELEFALFEETFAEAADKGHRDLTPLALANSRLRYLNRNAYPSQPFMREAIKRLEWRGIEWESWNADTSPGKIKLVLRDTDPVTAADRLARTKQALFEVAMDQDLSMTFMGQPNKSTRNGISVKQMLFQGDLPAFDSQAQGEPGPALAQWMSGIMTTMPGATSVLRPTINAHRALRSSGEAGIESADPRASFDIRACWACTAPTGKTHVEHANLSADANGYLALAVILAGGIAGLRHKLHPTDESHEPWEANSKSTLSSSITGAADALAADPLLVETMGTEFIDYWVQTRRWEAHSFAAAEQESSADDVTNWELERYFELI